MSHWTETATDEELVQGLCDIERGLTDWELARADDWHRLVCKEGRVLTKRQREIAEQIVRQKG